jgi:DNA helicase TIP49 (TBP-interacting protein)
LKNVTFRTTESFKSHSVSIQVGKNLVSLRTQEGTVIMFKKAFGAIREEFSGRAAKGYVIDIARYHRIQASPGFRQAAHYCLERLREAGVEYE